MYKSSVFNVEVKFKGELYLYNTLSAQIGCLSKSLTEIDKIDARDILRLYRDGFLVNEQMTIEQEYQSFFERRRLPKKTLGLLFTTTTSCNLKCGYCFENRVKRSSMSQETFYKSIAWIKNTVSSKKLDSIKLVLFGGEPMLEPELALALFEEINKFSQTQNIYVHPYEMITNGIYNDLVTLSRLSDAGLGEVQITFDGDKINNDLRRKSKDGIGKYDIILHNLTIYSKLFKVTVKINFDKSTISSVPTLLEDIIKSNPNLPQKIIIKPEPIAIYRKSSEHNYLDSNMYDPTNSELAAAFSEIINLCKNKGFLLDLSAVFPTPCMVTQENSYLLEPNGTLRSCISAFGLEDFNVGEVGSYGTYYSREKYQNTIEDTYSTGCVEKQCSFLPVCDGGCKYEVNLLGMPLKFMQCKFAYFTNIISEYVGYLVDTSKVIVMY